MKNYLLPLLVTLPLFLPLYAQTEPVEKGLNSITRDALKGQLIFLSSDWMEGRETGEKGCFMAADYIASLLSIYGIKPAGDISSTQLSMTDRMKGRTSENFPTYFQNINMIVTEIGENNKLELISESKKSEEKLIFDYKTDFSIGNAKVSFSNQSGVVFAGYGFRDDESGYNDFEDIDVRSNIINKYHR